MKKMLIVMVAMGLSSSAAFAADEVACKWKTLRTECPGKEVEAFKPYNGKKETPDEDKKATDEASCLAAAEKFSKIIRKGTLTAKKVHTVSYKGKDLGKTFEDKAECK
jgi:hypothetical protein